MRSFLVKFLVVLLVVSLIPISWGVVLASGNEDTVVTASADEYYYVKSDGENCTLIKSNYESIHSTTDFRMVYCELPLPSLEAGKEITKYDFKFYIAYNGGGIEVCKLGDAADWKNGVTAAVVEDARDGSESLGEILSGDSEGNAYFTADLTAYAKELVAAGKTKMYVGLYSTSTVQFYGTNGGEGKTPLYEYMVANSTDSEPEDTNQLVSEKANEFYYVQQNGESWKLITSNWESVRTDHSFAMVYCELPLPVVAEGKDLVNYELNYNIYYDGGGASNILIYKLGDAAEWKDGVSNDELLTAMSDSNIMHGITTGDDSDGDGTPTFTTNLTAYAKELIAANKTKMYIGISSTSTYGIWGTKAASENNKPVYGYEVGDPTLVIGDIVLDKANKTASVTVTVNRDSGIPTDLSLIMAAYDNDEMIDVDIDRKSTLRLGENIFSVQLDAGAEADKIKAMFWKDMIIPVKIAQ